MFLTKIIHIHFDEKPLFLMDTNMHTLKRLNSNVNEMLILFDSLIYNV